MRFKEKREDINKRSEQNPKEQTHLFSVTSVQKQHMQSASSRLESKEGKVVSSYLFSEFMVRRLRVGYLFLDNYDE